LQICTYIKVLKLPFKLRNKYKWYIYTDMEETYFMSPAELQALLGERLQQLRISKNLNQITTAEKAGISEKALRNLEAGRGSTVESLLRVLKALDSLEGLQLIAPTPSISPLALLRHAKPRRRVRQSAAERSAAPRGVEQP
jgi:transcriptional regulator with XRE-family HTH domain